MELEFQDSIERDRMAAGRQQPGRFESGIFVRVERDEKTRVGVRQYLCDARSSTTAFPPVARPPEISLISCRWATQSNFVATGCSTGASCIMGTPLSVTTILVPLATMAFT